MSKTFIQLAHIRLINLITLKALQRKSLELYHRLIQRILRRTTILRLRLENL
jgi:hypothetical protein